MKLDRHLFEWPSRHNVHVMLPLMLVFSFLLHAACVLVFRITYPPARRSPERPAQVFFLRPGSEKAVRMAPLLAASDPALFSPGKSYGTDLWKLTETAYIPSFDVETPALAPLPPVSPAAFPATLPMRHPAFPESVTNRKPGGPEPGPGLPTLVKLAGGLEGRSLTPPAGIRFTVPSGENLAPSVFLVSVSPEGNPLHLIPQTFGNETLNRSALRYLAESRFSKDPAATQPAWGTVTFLWGADVTRKNEP